MNVTTLRSLRTASLYQSSKPPPRPKHISPAVSLSLRYASSSSKLFPSKPSTPQILADKKLHPINGPLSTLPATLESPTRGPSQSLPSHLFALGKAYVSFYKTGVKNIYANSKSCRPIHARIDTKFKSSVYAAVKARALTRADYQLLYRNKYDLKRVPMFALVLLVCGEFTPLVVLALTGIVPWTCRIPKQINSDRLKIEERRRTSFRNLTCPLPAGNKSDTSLQNLNRMQLIHISWSLGLSSSVWDYLGGKLPGLPTIILRKRWLKRRSYLDMDDELLRQGGSAALEEISLEELRIACVERGVDVLGRPEKDLRKDLEAWLKSRQKVPMEWLVLTR